MQTETLKNENAMPIKDAALMGWAVVKHTNRHMLLEGPSGSGKTEMMSVLLRKLIADHLGIEVGDDDGDCKLWYLDAACTDGPEMRGLPKVREVKNEDGSMSWVTTWCSPDSLPQPGEKGLLLIDEPNTCADKSFQNSLYQLLGNDRRIGDYKLPDDVFIALCQNREQDAEGLEDMPAPLLSRCWVKEVRPVINQWIEDYAIEQCDIRIVAAARAYPELIEEWDGEAEGQSPNGRAMKDCSDALRGWEEDGGTSSGLIELFDGFIGRAAATKVATVVRQFNDLIPVSVIVESPNTAPLPKSIDMELSLMCALSKCADNQNLGSIIQYVERVQDNAQSQESKSLFKNLLLHAVKNGSNAGESRDFDRFVQC